MGSGISTDPNLIRLAEYYSNIFFTYIKSIDISKNNLKNENINLEVFDNYISYKNKLNYSLIDHFV
jgi:hypothetical protein